jgi:hypothetical protein
VERVSFDNQYLRTNFLELKPNNKEEKTKRELTSLQINLLVKEIGLCDPQFIRYHCRCIRKLGVGMYKQLAEMASEKHVKNPETLLASVLKEEMSSRGY